jgi:hypothetical protein
MMGAMRSRLAPLLLLLSLWHSPSFGQCAPAPDSPYFFRNLAEQRAEAKLAADRTFYESLLSDHFSGKDHNGKALPRQEFIESELSVKREASRKGFYTVRNFSLVEHHKGLAITSYLLVEGDIGEGNSNAHETWQREVFEVQDGKWRLVSIDDTEPRTAHQAQNAPGG